MKLNCSLKEKQVENLYKAVYKEMLLAKEKNISFDPKSFMTNLFEKIQAKKNVNVASTFLQIVPTLMKEARDQDTLQGLDFSLDSNQKLIEQFRDTENGLLKTLNYFRPSATINDLMISINVENNINNDPNNVEDEELDDILNDPFRWLAKDAFSSTMQELEPQDPNAITKKEKKDPNKVRIYKTIRRIRLEGRQETALSPLTYQGKVVNLRPKMLLSLNGEETLDATTVAHIIRSNSMVDKGIADPNVTQAKDIVVLVVADEFGKTLYFDEQGSITTKENGGKPVYQFLRDVRKAENSDKLRVTDIYGIEDRILSPEELIERAANKVKMSVESWIKSQGTTYEKMLESVEKQQQESFAELKTLRDKVRAGDKSILLDITGVSAGIADVFGIGGTVTLESLLTEFKISYQNMNIRLLAGDKNAMAAIYIGDVFYKVDRPNLDKEYIEQIAAVLMDPNLTNKQKHDFYLQFSSNAITTERRKLFVNYVEQTDKLTILYRTKPGPTTELKDLTSDDAYTIIVDSLLKETILESGKTFATNLNFNDELLTGKKTFYTYNTSTKKLEAKSYRQFLYNYGLNIISTSEDAGKGKDKGNSTNPYFVFQVSNSFIESLKDAEEEVNADVKSRVAARKAELVGKLKKNDKLSGTITALKSLTDATFTLTAGGVLVEGRYEKGVSAKDVKEGEPVTFIVNDIITSKGDKIKDVVSIYNTEGKKIGQVSETDYTLLKKQKTTKEKVDDSVKADAEFTNKANTSNPEDDTNLSDIIFAMPRSSKLPNGVTQEEIDAAKEWWDNSPLSKFIKLEHMANIVNSDVYARFIIAGKRLEDTSIQLDTATGSSAVDLYHEAWHAFSQLFLTKKQKTKLYAETRKRLNNYDLSPIEVEEILAEEYREYAKDPKAVGDAPVRNTIFRQIWNAIKALFGKRSTQEDLFERLFFASKNPKLLNKYTPLVDNAMFNKLNRARGIMNTETKELALNYQDSLKVSNQLDSALSEFIDNVHNKREVARANNVKDAAGNLVRANKSGTIYILANDRFRAVAYKEIKGEFQKKLEAFNTQLENTPEEDFNARTVLNNKIRIINTTLANWDDAITFHKEHSTFDLIKQKYIEISEEEEEIDNDNSTPESAKDSERYSDKKVGEQSLLQLAEKETLYIIKSLFKQVDGARVEGPLGFPELADFSKTWNIITKVIGGEKDPTKMYDKLVAAAELYPELRQLINTKLPNPRDIDTIEEFNIKAAFWQDFKKTQLRYVQLTVDKDAETGDYKSEVTDASIEFKNIINKFKSDFNSSAETKFIAKTDDNKSVLKIDEVVKAFPNVDTTQQQIAFANALGIDLQDLKSIKDELGNNTKKYGIPYLFGITKAVHALKNKATATKEQQEFIAKFLANPVDALYGKIPDGIYPKAESEKKVLQNLAKLQSKFGTNYSSFSVLNAEKNLVNEFIEDNTVSMVVDAINTVQNGTDLWLDAKYKYMSYLNPLINGFTEQSQLLNRIFEREENTWDRRSDGKLDLVMVSGTQMVDTGEGNNTTALDVHSKYIQELNMMLKSGFQEFMRHASKSSSFGMKAANFKLYVDIDEFRPGGNADQFAVNNIFLGYIQAELIRIQKIRANREEFKKYVGYNREIKSADGKTVLGMAGEFFTAFDNILTDKTKNEIIDKVKDGNLINYLESDLELKKQITEQVTKYFNDQTYVNQKDFQKAKWIDPALHNKLKKYELSTEQEETMLIKAHTMNAWIHNFETASLIYGDIVQYNHAKQELHKRNSGSTSGGRGFMTDLYTQNFINSSKINGTSYGAKLASLSEFGPEYNAFNYNGTYNTAIAQDVKRDSVYVKHIEKALREDYKKRGLAKEEIDKRVAIEIDKYNQMEEGDGQGFITIDAYRTLRLTEKNWGADQEKLFQDIINGKEVKAEDITHFFPVYKLQHFGHLANTALPVNAMHKFALMPLIPSVIAGSDLESLHHQMMKNNIQYFTFQTGSKTGSVTSQLDKDGKPAADVIYDDNGEQKTLKSDIQFTPNTIYLEYLKNVTSVPDKYKSKTVFATQLRKLILEGLYENGKIVNANYASYIQAYENAVDDYTDILKKELLEEIGYEKVDGKYVTGDVSKFMDVIQRELERKEIPEHLIDYIQVGSDNKITKDLSLHMLSGDIEKMITALVEKRIVKQKVKGEALVQVSSSISNGLWDSGFKFGNANTKEIEKYLGSNNLPFYHPDDIDLDVKYKDYTKEKLAELLKTNKRIIAEHSAYYTDRNRYNLIVETEYIEAILAGKTPKVKSVSGNTSAMKVAIALQGDFTNLLKLKHNDGEPIGTRARLNEMIKNDTWLDKDNNRKAITMTAVRIPVQGLNSMEFMEVYEFLDPSAGNIIIPPSEIVAKSGADFDVDKLTTFMPNIDARGQYVESGMDTETLDRLIAASKKKGDKAEMTRLIKLQKAALENRLIDSIRGILQLPDNYATLVRPNDTYLMKEIADELIDLLPEYGRYKKISPTNTLEVGYNLHKHEANMIGKDVLGIIALENALNPLYTSLGADLPKTYKGLIKNKITKKYEEDPSVDYEMRLLLDHNTMPDGSISLSGIDSADKQDTVADLMSHLMNGSVDVEKDAWIFFIQANKEVAPMLLTLLKAGVPKRQAIFFVSQPLVKEYARQQRLYGSTYANLIGKSTATDESAKYNALQATLRQTDISNAIYEANEARLNKALTENADDTQIVLRLEGISGADKMKKTTIGELKDDLKNENITLNELSSINVKDKSLFKSIIANPYDEFYHPLSWANYKDVALAATKNIDKFSMSDLERVVKTDDTTSPTAIAAFMHYLEYEKQVSTIAKLKRMSNPDTTTSKTIQEIMQKRLGLDMLTESSQINSKLVSKLRNESILGSFFDNTLTEDLVEPLFPLTDDKRVSDYLLKYIKEREIPAKFGEGEEGVTNFITSFKNALVNFIYQNKLNQIVTRSEAHPSVPESFTSLDHQAFVADFMSMLSENKHLKELYSILEQITDVPVNIFDAKTKKIKGQIAVLTLNNKAVVKGELASAYHQNLIDLADDNVIKVKDPVKNKEISDMFKMLPLMSILQNGVGNTKYGLSYVLPDTAYFEIIEPASRKFIQNGMTTSMFDRIAKRMIANDPNVHNYIDEAFATKPSTSFEIDFQEEPTTGYKNRTIKNASADATIAIAYDFNSAGEKLTKSSVLSQNKKYLPVSTDVFSSKNDVTFAAGKIAQELNKLPNNEITLNIAGNGIYTLKGIMSQSAADNFTLELLEEVLKRLNPEKKIVSIRSGGQTGFDEAGAKAGIKLGIPTSILAPKGWKFRDVSGIDISNEEAFKARFATTQQQAPVGEVKKDIEISEELKNIIYKSGKEKEDYEITLVDGVSTFIVTDTLPTKLSRGFKVFYSDYAGGQGLFKRSGKKVTIPGFEDIELMMEQGTNNVYELSTGLGMPNTKLTTQKEILAELETIFKEKNVRGVLETSPKINANNPNVIIEGQNKTPELSAEAVAVTDAIKNALPIEISEVVTVVNDVPLNILGRDDLYLSLKDILNENGVTDEVLINWLGVNKDKAGVNPKYIMSNDYLSDLVAKIYNKKKQVSAHPELKNNKLALESFEKWVDALEKYPVAFRELMLTHAIKYLNPQRRSKYVLQLSEVALTNAYGILMNKPHEANRIGKLYDSEVLATVSDAIGHEPSASGNGYWVHVPRTSSSAFMGHDSYEKFKDFTERAIQGTEERIQSEKENLEPGKYEDLVAQLEELENKEVVFNTQEPNLDKKTADDYGFDDFSYVRVESTYSRWKKNVKPSLALRNQPHIEQLGEDYEGYYIHGYNTERGKPDTKIVKITKEQAEEIWQKQKDEYPAHALEVADRNKIYQLKQEIQRFNPAETEKSIKRYEEELNKYKEQLETIKPEEWSDKGNDFSVNVDLLRKLSPSTWCTSGSMTAHYVENYDNYLLIVNGVTVAGIEATNETNSEGKIRVKEVTSRNNNGTASIDHLDDTIAFFEKHNLDLSNASVQKAINQRDNNKSDEDFVSNQEWDMDDFDMYPPMAWDDPYDEEEDRGDVDMPGRYEAEAEEERYNVSMIVSVDEALQQLANNNTASLRHFNELQPEIRENEQLARMAVENNAHNITYVSEEVPYYTELAEATVRAHPYSFPYVSQAVKDIPGLREIYEQDQRDNEELPFSKTNSNLIQGYYDAKNDKVVVVAANTPADEAAKVAIHEVAHRGMLRMAKDLNGTKELYEALFSAKAELSKKLPELLKRTGHKNAQELIKDYGFDINTKDGQAKLLMELAARWAETLVDKPKPSWWKEFLASIKKWIAQFTGKVLNEEEVNALVGGFVKYGTNVKVAADTNVETNESDEIPDGQTDGLVNKKDAPDKTIKIHDATVIVKADGKMYKSNGNLLTDQTTINKVKIKIEFEAGTLRMSNFNKSNYYILSDNTILGSGATNLGKESINKVETKEIILDRATPYKKSCEQ